MQRPVNVQDNHVKKDCVGLGCASDSARPGIGFYCFMQSDFFLSFSESWIINID